MECQYALFSFGIRRDQFPLTADGVLKREHFLEWQRDRQAIEEANVLVCLEPPPAANASQQGAQHQLVFSPPSINDTSSHLECLYALISSGIRRDQFPLTGQAIEEANVLVCLESPLAANISQQGAQRQLVVSPPSINDTSLGREGTSVKKYPEGCYVPHHHLVDVTSNAVLSPTPNDVLFGRGKAIKEHPANIVLHRLVDERMLEYEMSSKWEKTVTASEIMAMIKERHGRFLKMVGGNWVEVDSEVAREKVTHVFRSQRRRLITSSAAS
jgi:hypothetical protein